VGTERHTSPDDTGLCYLEARNVELPAGKLAGLHLCSRDDHALGAVDGVLIEPASRRVRYIVVKRSGWRGGRYMLALENPTQIDREHNVLRIGSRADDLRQERFDADAVRPFSDDDLLTAMFG
jgi:hypothetical protein